MHILFNGCSYTWGDELEHREQDRFSTLVSNHYNASHSNISACGRSNDAITRTTMEWLTAGNVCDLAIIQWTLISRIEGYTPEEQYTCVTTQSPYKWKEFYKKYYHDQLGVDTLFKNYYLLEQYFIQQKIPYLFLLHDNWNKIITTTDSIWKQLIIKKNLHFLRGNLSDNDCILDLNNNIKPNKGHPNPLGHQKISQHIIDTIGTLQ